MLNRLQYSVLITFSVLGNQKFMDLLYCNICIPEVVWNQTFNYLQGTPI